MRALRHRTAASRENWNLRTPGPEDVGSALLAAGGWDCPTALSCCRRASSHWSPARPDAAEKASGPRRTGDGEFEITNADHLRGQRLGHPRPGPTRAEKALS
jgi:hypothetical protein